jgi:ATP-binding cassette subfamily B protein
MPQTPKIDTQPDPYKGLHWRIIKYFLAFQFRPKYRWFRLIVLSCAAISTLFWHIGIPYQMKNLIDLITPMTPPIDTMLWQEILSAFVVIGGVYLVGLLAEIGITTSVVFSTPLIQRDIENEGYEKLQQFSYDFYTNSFIGSLVAQLRRFSEAYIQLEVEFTENLMRLFIRCIALVTIILIFSPPIFLPVILWALVFFTAIAFLIKKKMKYERLYAMQDTKVTATLADSVSNYLTIKVFGREPEELDRFKTANHLKTRAIQKGWAWSAVMFTTQHTLNVFVQLMVLFFALKLWSQGEMSLGTVVFLQMLMTDVSKSLNDFSNTLKVIYRALAKSEEMMVLIEAKPDLLDPKNPQRSKISKGHIHFDRLTFNYGEAHSVFSNFDLTIKAGQKIGLVGHSGAGKSSFVKLLLRFMDPQSGQITIDKQGIHKITQQDLRQAISYVPQEPTLFHRSLWDNIAYGDLKASDTAIKKVIKDSYLAELIDRLPNSVDTMVGERGVKLSGGERQRVAIARAMLKKSPILILDEATSSLDSTSEMYIQKVFETLMKGRTTIVIAHRLSTIARLDRILVLDNGQIVEDGTHAQLVHKKNGHYAKLYKNQKDGMLIDD